jgi:hypothetical protein
VPLKRSRRGGKKGGGGGPGLGSAMQRRRKGGLVEQRVVEQRGPWHQQGHGRGRGGSRPANRGRMCGWGSGPGMVRGPSVMGSTE